MQLYGLNELKTIENNYGIHCSAIHSYTVLFLLIKVT